MKWPTGNEENLKRFWTFCFPLKSHCFTCLVKKMTWQLQLHQGNNCYWRPLSWRIFCRYDAFAFAVNTYHSVVEKKLFQRNKKATTKKETLQKNWKPIVRLTNEWVKGTKKNFPLWFKRVKSGICLKWLMLTANQFKLMIKEKSKDVFCMRISWPKRDPAFQLG